MKQYIAISMMLLSVALLGGCEKTDYKHPLHRAQGR